MTRFNTRPTRARLSRLAFRFSRVLLCMCAVTYTLQCQPPPAAVASVEPPTAAGSTQMIAPVVVGNPMAPGFDLSGSDHRAVEIADRVMARLGGREGWEHTRHLTWRFFGKRRHVWDKWTGDLRFEAGDRTVLMNLNDRTGRSWRSGLLVEDPDTLAADVDGVYRAWIKDLPGSGPSSDSEPNAGFVGSHASAPGPLSSGSSPSIQGLLDLLA